MYCPTLSLISALNQVGGLRQARPIYPRVPIEWEAGWSPGTVSTGAENLALTGIRQPHLPPRSDSLYRLSYPGPLISYSLNIINWVFQIRFASIYSILSRFRQLRVFRMNHVEPLSLDVSFHSQTQKDQCDMSDRLRKCQPFKKNFAPLSFLGLLVK